MSKRWPLFFLALVLIATGAVLYLRQQMLKEFQATVEPWFSKGPLAGKIQIGGYDVSLLQRAGIIKDLRPTDPVLVDNPALRLEFLGIKRLIIRGFKEDPRFGIPLHSQVVGQNLRFSFLFKETGRRLNLRANSRSDLVFHPKKDLLDLDLEFSSDQGDLAFKLELAKIKDYLLLLGKGDLEDLPQGVFLSRVTKIVPHRLSFRYEDRGLGRALFYAACPDNCDQRLEEVARDLERELSGSLTLEGVKKALVKILREGRGGIEITVVNKEDLALKDFFFVFLGLALEESAQKSSSKTLFERLSPYFEFQIKAW